MTNQLEIYEALEQILAKDIEFDAIGIAKKWTPKPEYKNIIIDPAIAYGHPIIRNNNTPTDAVYKLWQAENGNYRAVSDWFEVEVPLIQEAVQFEVSLAA